MDEIKIFRFNDIESVSLVGQSNTQGGSIKRIIYPQNVNTKGLIFGFVEVYPGHAPHRWHNHVTDKAPGFEVVYPKDFEEVYYILSGRGVVQWKTEAGKVKEKEVGPGDTIFFPVGVPEHQLLNNGTEKMTIVYCGTPTTSIKVGASTKKV